MDVSIRLYNDSDLERVIAIWMEGWASTGLAFKPPILNAETLRTRIPEACTRGIVLIHVACVRTDVVAFIIFKDDKLDQLFVDPRFQRKGIGRKLVEFARATRPHGFWLTAAAASQGANRFYQREGLKLTGVVFDPELPGHEFARYEWKATNAGLPGS